MESSLNLPDSNQKKLLRVSGLEFSGLGFTVGLALNRSSFLLEDRRDPIVLKIKPETYSFQAGIALLYKKNPA